MSEQEYLPCDGCGGKIFPGDEVITLKFIEGEQELILHKNMDCLLQLDEVKSGTVNEIKTVDSKEWLELEGREE